jgi:hypothetical protein
MTFDEVVRFAHASSHALARAGTDNRARPLIELAYDDWRPFLEVASEYAATFMVGPPGKPAKFNVESISEVELYGCVIRPKANTIPPAVAFGAALSALPGLSKAAGCFTGIHVTALIGIDPRMKP